MDVVELVNKYGFPIVMAVGMGYIIKYVWEWSTKEVKPVTEQQIRRAIIKGIKHAAWFMTETPVPILGIAGIRFTARRIKTWRESLGAQRAGPR